MPACLTALLLVAGTCPGISQAADPAPVLEVADPFIELHTAPGRGYPVFHVIEKGEQVELLKRKTNWYKVRAVSGETGWTKATQLGRTLQPTGLPADLPEVTHGQYLESSWRVGFTAGMFEESPSFSLTAGYRPLTWLGAELEAGKIYNQSVTSDYYGANLVIEPLHKWSLTPYALAGYSQFSFDARQKVLLSDLGDADGVTFGGGLGYYIGRNFLIRAEYRVYSVSSNSDSTGLSEWKIGLNTFFLSARTPRGISTALFTGLLAVTPMGLAQAQEAGSAPVQVIEPDIEPRSISEADIDAEFFEVGAFAGMLTIDNFSSEPLFGVSAAFHATEDFFLQFNYGMSEAGLTSFEELSGSNVRLLTDDDRDYTYYDFLVGYNIFPGEIFFSDSLTFNSAFYLVGGVGNTEFGGESNFTTTLGTGFRIVLLDWLTVHVDFRDHMFNSDLIRESQLTHNIELSSGITLFF